MKFSCWRIVQLILILVFITVAQEQQVEIGDFFAKVYLAPTTSSRFIGLAQKGESYPVLETRESWLRIRFKNAVGWIQVTQVKNNEAQAASKEATAAESSPQNTEKPPISSNLQSVPIDSPIGLSSDPVVKSDQKISTETSVSQKTRSNSKTTAKPDKGTDERSQQKRDSKHRNWFNQQNFMNNLPANQNVEDLDIKYFQVTIAPARILLYLNPDSPILGMAKKGEVLPLVGEGDSWCKVMYADTVGWIEKRNGKIIDSPKSLLASDFLFAGIIALILSILVVFLLVILSIMRKAKGKQKEITIQKNVLIIAKNNKTIQYTLTDTTTTLERCFAEIGFNITVIKEPAAIRSTIENMTVDIMIIDWKFDRNVVNFMERLFTGRPGSEKILCIVYNTSDPSVMQPGRTLPNTVFLGQTFSDRDIFKLVTPLIISENSKSVQKSIQSSALEGNIADGNLLEVLQFIEIGSKTGCLLIETDRPFGLIYFLNGRIIYAATAQEIIGRDAIFKILNLREGNFRFILNRKPKSSNVNLSTLEILMEWTKAVDEANGH